MLVTAVIPAYNAEKHIAETLDSICAQTYRPIEIVVVDDGSVDRTAYIVKERFPEVHYVYQPNAGLASARNTGIKHAKGQYIAFVDSDDLWLPHKIATQMTRLAHSQAVWCYSDCLYFRESLDHVVYRLSAQLHPREGMITEPLLLNNFIASPTPIIPRDVLIDTGLFDETISPIAADWDMWLRLAARFPVIYVNEPLAGYRLHPDSMMSVSSIPSILQATLAVLSAGLNRLDNQNRTIAKKARANIYFRAGLTYLKRGDKSGGRRMIVQALKADPLQMRLYFYQLATYLPGSFMEAANRARHWSFRMAKPIAK